MNMSATDLELLTRYARHRQEDAFAELVRRHLNLVHSAALRQVRAPELAEEVAQTVFSDLARQAERIPSGTVLAAWLYQVTRRRAIDVVRREASRRLRENVAHELHAMNACADDWVRIEPLLDEAMHALDDVDRAAVLLRYFENKSLREVGQQLGASEDAAQKRVSRAVERLREFFEKSGVTVGAGGIAMLLSAQAVQAAPAGLGVSIVTSSALIGASLSATIATSTTPAALNLLHAKSIASIVASAFLAGTSVYWVQERRAERLRDENAALVNSHQLMQEERDAARAQATLAETELASAREGRAELLRLRGQVGVLRQQTNDLVRVRTQDRLRAVLSRAPDDRGEAARDPEEERRMLKPRTAKVLTMPLLLYASDHDGQLPATFEMAASSFSQAFQMDPFLPSESELWKASEEFEIVYRGSRKDLTNAASTILIRERQARQRPDGQWEKAYGFGDGHGEVRVEASNNFEPWERQRASAALSEHPGVIVNRP